MADRAHTHQYGPEKQSRAMSGKPIEDRSGALKLGEEATNALRHNPEILSAIEEHPS